MRAVEQRRRGGFYFLLALYTYGTMGIVWFIFFVFYVLGLGKLDHISGWPGVAALPIFVLAGGQTAIPMCFAMGIFLERNLNWHRLMQSSWEPSDYWFQNAKSWSKA